MNPDSLSDDSLSDNARPSRVRPLALSALLLLAGLALTAPAVAAEDCSQRPVTQQATCMLLEETGCLDTTGDRTTCVVPRCEGSTSVGTSTYAETTGTNSETCYYSAGDCAVGRWRESTGVPREDTCFAPPSGPVVGSCTGSDYGAVLLGIEVCYPVPSVTPCPSGYGVVVGGDPECHDVGACTSNPYGVAVDGSGCVTLEGCDDGQVGYKVNGNGAACVGEPPSVAPCSTGYGVEVGGSGYCVTVCPSGSYGVSATGCHTVAACPAGTVGYRVDGNGVTCVANPTGPCPNGRTGVVVLGQEVCPVP